MAAEAMCRHQQRAVPEGKNGRAGYGDACRRSRSVDVAVTQRCPKRAEQRRCEHRSGRKREPLLECESHRVSLRRGCLDRLAVLQPAHDLRQVRLLAVHQDAYAVDPARDTQRIAGDGQRHEDGDTTAAMAVAPQARAVSDDAKVYISMSGCGEGEKRGDARDDAIVESGCVNHVEDASWMQNDERKHEEDVAFAAVPARSSFIAPSAAAMRSNTADKPKQKEDDKEREFAGRTDESRDHRPRGRNQGCCSNLAAAMASVTQMPTCVRPTAPTPSTLPASISSGLMEASSHFKDATRFFFDDRARHIHPIEQDDDHVHEKKHAV